LLLKAIKGATGENRPPSLHRSSTRRQAVLVDENQYRIAV